MEVEAPTAVAADLPEDGSIIRAFRTELDPTVEQRHLLSRAAGCARWSYNWALARWREQYTKWKVNKDSAVALGGFKVVDSLLAILLVGDWPSEKEWENAKFVAAALTTRPPSWMSLHKELTQVKKEPQTAWLTEVSAYVVREGVKDCGTAYAAYFRRLKEGKRGKAAGEPRFRSRLNPSGRGFHIDQSSALKLAVHERDVMIASVGRVKLREHGYIPVGADYRGMSVREVAGRWYVAVQVKIPTPVTQPLDPEKRVGVEIGVRQLAVTSSDYRCGAMRDRKQTQRDERRLALHSRRMARRHKRGAKSSEQSRGWKQELAKVQTIHARIACVRRDLLQQTTTRIVRHERAAVLVVRDSKVSQMLARAGKTGPEARARNAIAPMVAQVGMYELRRQLAYKQGWRGGTVEVVPHDSPTTRTCSKCGVVRETDPGYPSWRCPHCGTKHDRELNSATNLKDFAGGSVPGKDGGRAARRKTPQGAQRPSEPEPQTSQSIAPAGPDGAETSALGTGNRAAGEQSLDGKGIGPIGGAVSAPTPSIHAPIDDQRGDAPSTTKEIRGVGSLQDGLRRGRSQRQVKRPRTHREIL